VKRVLASLLGLLVAWLALANASATAVEPPQGACPVYDYNSQHVCAPSADSATERGAPAVHDPHIAYNAVDRWSHGAAARPDRPTPSPIITYDLPTLLVQSAGVVMTTLEATPDSSGLLSSFQRSDVAAKGVSGLSDDVVGLATRNITNSGDTVLGHFPGYLTKANSKGASYFDIGDAWNGLTPSQRWAANTHFLDTRIAAGDRVLLSVPKGDIRPGSYLAQEVQYLTSNGYRWTNQWSLVPRG
jgi:hypothetical protein